jgi:hypothetical protein
VEDFYFGALFLLFGVSISGNVSENGQWNPASDNSLFRFHRK